MSKLRPDISKKDEAISTFISLILLLFYVLFFICYLAAPRLTLSHNRGDNLTNPMLITAFLRSKPVGHREPLNEIGTLNPGEWLVGYLPPSIVSDCYCTVLTQTW